VDVAGFCRIEGMIHIFIDYLKKGLREQIVKFHSMHRMLDKAVTAPENFDESQFDEILSSNKIKPMYATIPADNEKLAFELDGGAPMFDQETGYKKVILSVIRTSKLTEEDKATIRIFYWAAYYGRKDAIEIMVELFRWSPMLKSFKNRDVLGAAILGERADVV
jgi:hypothetical protein